jgi:hypothetical protein
MMASNNTARTVRELQEDKQKRDEDAARREARRQVRELAEQNREERLGLSCMRTQQKNRKTLPPPPEKIVPKSVEVHYSEKTKRREAMYQRAKLVRHYTTHTKPTPPTPHTTTAGPAGGMSAAEAAAAGRP